MRTAFSLAALALVLASCVSDDPGASSSSHQPWTVATYQSDIPHAPKLPGWTQIKSVGVKFREYEIDHPKGKWLVSYEDDKAPLTVRTASGKTHPFTDEWYPEEGGADSAAAYAFVKGDETLIIVQGTSAVTHEESHFRFRGDELVEQRRYAAKGPGMGEDLPGVEPEHKVYPPL